ncbi:hypothetical protein KAFR_0A00310 [Kazachstania africana CBS 2517]|uniref:Nuclear fusion protein KAR5 n=1 Tax=Kazachstania africana (strain ATCC 22294 / BCRC 22015 / CBS 2517 / CECT 1963 / NBRC 1671 / NRRL Y-8276) TaxID=1071382 RepID=H2AM69_KAZAF|nr:hypothetical protein KAFR_0A00310 [Kazachstania africana CBS 2517]CCF55469.1 hypothetical protein KAFR_0A00310 [Kazachstania africana CBS 2517]
MNFIPIIVIFCNAVATAGFDILEYQKDKINTPASVHDDSFQLQYIESKFPFLQQTCVKDALSNFLHTCQMEGVESIGSKERVETSIKLSICQFEASGLIDLVPAICLENKDDSELLIDCMFQMNKLKAEWWTTYNGYYQSLSSICSDYSLPFHKQQILETYMNVTEWFININDVWDDKFNDIIFDVERKTETHITEVLNMLERCDQIAQTQESSILDMFSHFQKDLELILSNSKQQVEVQLVKKDEQIVSGINDIAIHVENLTNELESQDIIQQIMEFKNNNLKSFQDIAEASNELVIKERASFEHMKTYQEQIKSSMDEFIGGLLVTQNDSLQNFDLILQDSISNDLLPQLHMFTKELTNEWLSRFSEEMAVINDGIFESFEVISSKLNSTLDKIDILETKLSKIYEFFNIINAIISKFAHGCVVLKDNVLALVTSHKKWVILPLSVTTFKLLKNLILTRWKTEIYHTPVFIMKTLTLAIAVFLGNRLGAILCQDIM